MKTKVLVLIIGVLSILGCDNNDLKRNIDGQYIGTFQRGLNSSNVELTLDENIFFWRK